MYRKTFVDGSEHYFVYAPPQTKLDPIISKLPKPPYAGAPRELSSVYYYWWSFLRLNPDYLQCCERPFDFESPLAWLRADFGDVRDDDFIEWWKRRGVHCFAEPRQSEYVELLDPAAVSPNDGRALISVPLDADIEETVKSIRSILRPLFDEFRGKNGHFSKRDTRSSRNRC